MQKNFTEDDVNILVAKCCFGEVSREQIYNDAKYSEIYVFNQEKINEALWFHRVGHIAYLHRDMEPGSDGFIVKTNDIQRYMEVVNVAKLFGKSSANIAKLCQKGKIRHFEKVGERYIIDVYAEWPKLFEAEIEAEKKARLNA